MRTLVPRRRTVGWSDWFWLWDVYILGGCAVTVAVVFILDDQVRGEPLGAAAALTALGAMAAAFGRSMMAERRGGPLPWLFLTGIAGLLATALAFSPASIAALPVLYPLVFMSLRLRSAVVVTSLVNLIPAAVVAAREGVGGSGFATVAALTLLGLVFSPLLGVFITRTVEQSVERAALLRELAESRAQVALLSREAGAAAERARLAREIHDTLAQGFTSIVTLAQAIESELGTDPDAAHRHVELVQRTARDNLAEARAMVEELTPSALDAGSLVDSIRRQGDRLADETGIAVTVSAGPECPGLDRAGEVVLLRAAQEAFANVRKHSGAAAVTVDVRGTGGGVRLLVTDDGRGFDDGGHGFGLRGMRDRVEQVGGRVSVRSRPGSGTAVEVEVPA
ncbi:sensor histidine kinase [Spirillospora sp. CA-294931]|uniref:sensor histidine kinase n=1 Tax=Spirillospora sp. CA-294931 TaxID=3240042 RepID=UPI003D8ED719